MKQSVEEGVAKNGIEKESELGWSRDDSGKCDIGDHYGRLSGTREIGGEAISRGEGEFLGDSMTKRRAEA